jgi:hypothetical protein
LLCFALYSYSAAWGQKAQDISIEVINYYGIPSNISLWCYLHNDTKDTLLILKPRPKKYIPSMQMSAEHPPEFFDMRIEPAELVCEYPPAPMSRSMKATGEFLKIPPQGKREIFLSTSGYDQGICADASTQKVKLSISYQFDEAFASEETFRKAIQKKGYTITDDAAASSFFEMLQRSYQGAFTAIVEISLDELPLRKDDEEERFRLKAEYEKGVLFDSLRFENRSHLLSMTALKRKDFDSSYCQEIFDKLIDIYPRVSRVYHHYTYKDDYMISCIEKDARIHVIFTKSEIEEGIRSFLDSLQMGQTDSIFRNHQHLGIYYSLSDLADWAKGKLFQRVWVLSEGTDGKIYFSPFMEHQSPFNGPNYIFDPTEVSYADGKITSYMEESPYYLDDKIRKLKTFYMNESGDLFTDSFVNIDRGNAYKIEQPYFLKIE